CFNKSKGVLITDLKLKAFRNPQPSWGFSIDKKARTFVRACQFIRWKAKVNAMAQRQNEYVTIKAYNRRRIS
ncbi:hypothetical protein ACH55_11430, partial [Salmonella enterica subsp. enterica serovar Typhimurium]